MKYQISKHINDWARELTNLLEEDHKLMKNLFDKILEVEKIDYDFNLPKKDFLITGGHFNIKF